MSFVFLVLHFPEPAHRGALARGMAEMGEGLAGAPGLVEVGSWHDPARDCLVGLSRWESREAFEAIGITPLPEGSAPPPGERAPRQRFFLEPTDPSRLEAGAS